MTEKELREQFRKLYGKDIDMKKVREVPPEERCVRGKSEQVMLGIDGFKGKLSDVARHTGISYTTLYQRVHVLGYSIDEATDTERFRHLYDTGDGSYRSVREIAKSLGVSVGVLYRYLRITNKDISKAIKLCKKAKENSCKKSKNVKRKCKIYTTKDGFSGSLTEIAEKYNINENTLRTIIYSGKSIDTAISNTKR